VRRGLMSSCIGSLYRGLNQYSLLRLPRACASASVCTPCLWLPPLCAQELDEQLYEDFNMAAL
jgi:hypothetical protein